MAKLLREGLRTGIWSEWLPGERSLCARLHVSRPTVRAALNELRREGLIEVAHGRRSRIVRRQSASRRRAGSKVVCMLSPVPLAAVRPFVIFLVDEIRQHLAEAGCRLEVEASSRFYTQRPYKALESLIHEKSAACWVLFLATFQMQAWFADRGLPVVVDGSLHLGIHLPSVDLDYRAACRHAGGTLLAKGHRHIALLIENIRRAGDEESKTGFLESAQAMPGVSPQLTLAEHNGTVPAICAKVDTLLRLASPPTAFLVANSAHVLTVIGHLLRNQIRLPDNLALISRDDDPFLNYIVPTVARYSCSPVHFAGKVSRLILQLARGETVPHKRVLLMPNLIKGETLG